MNTTESGGGLNAIIESVGGADLFVWLVTFVLLLVGAGILYFTNRDME